MNCTIEEQLCIKLKDVFLSLLNVIYINHHDIPNCTIIFIFDYNEKDKNFYMMDLKNKLYKKIGYDVNIIKYSDLPVYVHKFENCKLWFALKTNDGEKTLLRPLARNFFDRMIKPLTRIFSGTECFLPYLLNYVECYHEEDVIIAKAVLEFFYYIYGIDINFINNLSVSTYEGRGVNCGIIIPYKGVGRGKKNKKSNIEIKLTDVLVFNNREIRKIRKLLEIATPPLNLLIGQRKEILGFTSDDKRHFECKFMLNGYLKWKVFFEDKCIEYNNGVFRIPTKRKNNYYINSLNELCESKKQFEKLEHIISEAAKQEYGALLIIADKDNIKLEIERLCQYGRGIQIKKLNLYDNKLFINNLTSIDGAMFLDFNCNCYGIGIILDGDAVIEGLTSRGARYNSAINYIERQKQQGKNFIAVIISEDGTVDIYPNIK